MNNLTFHIGHHKTATTWLQMRYFTKHPQINLLSNFLAPWDDPFLSYLIGTSNRKFDTQVCVDRLNNYSLQGTEGCVNVVSAERLSGHPFSGGYDSYSIAERIHECFSGAKIIIVIRNQVDMLISMYQQLVREGYLGTFTDLIQSKHWKGTSFSLDFLEYDLLISKYKNLFSDERVLVLLYEDMKSEQQVYVNRISDFLGVDVFSENAKSRGKVNISLRSGDIRALRLTNQFRKTEFNPFPVVSMKDRYLHYLSRLLSLFFFSSPIVGESDKEFIRSYYSASNSNLSKILGRELPGYF